MYLWLIITVELLDLLNSNLNIKNIQAYRTYNNTEDSGSFITGSVGFFLTTGIILSNIQIHNYFTGSYFSNCEAVTMNKITFFADSALSLGLSTISDIISLTQIGIYMNADTININDVVGINYYYGIQLLKIKMH